MPHGASLENILSISNATVREQLLFEFNTHSRCPNHEPSYNNFTWGRRNHSLPSDVVRKWPQSAGPEMALNMLDGRMVEHHPALRALLPTRAYPVSRDQIVELGGLRVPWAFDCDDAAVPRGMYQYERAVPSRWYACQLHRASVVSGMPLVTATLPMVDEEYQEHAAIVQSVLRAPAGPFAMAEVGARWGTWGYRARAIARERRPELRPFVNYFVEPNQGSCEGIHAIRDINAFPRHEIKVDCTFAQPHLLLAWAKETLRTHRVIDVVDIDIQSAETKLLANPEVKALLERHVVRVIIGTHTGWPIFARWSTHATMVAAFSHWHVRCNRPVSTYTGCIERFLRGCKTDPAARFDWAEMVRRQCYHETPFGKIASYDGELILDNPRFVREDGELMRTAQHASKRETGDSSLSGLKETVWLVK